jgi:hypothetical protein
MHCERTLSGPYSGEMPNAAEAAAGPVVERFAGSAGRWLGYFGMAFGVFVVVSVLLDDPDGDWQIAAFGVGIAGLSWVILVRPAVALHEHGVLMRNMLRDSFVPSSKIDRCKTAQTLMIRVGADTFHGLGVSRSARSMMREKRGERRGLLGSLNSMTGAFGADGSDSSERAHKPYATQEVEGPSYQEYVEGRIERAAQDAKPDDREPLTVWAPTAVAAFAAAALGFASLLL